MEAVVVLCAVVFGMISGKTDAPVVGMTVFGEIIVAVVNVVDEESVDPKAVENVELEKVVVKVSRVEVLLEERVLIVELVDDDSI